MPLHTMFSPVMLLTALLDLSTACPLILQPPQLVLEFGEPAVANCTTTLDGHSGMFWTYGNESYPEDLGSFTILEKTHIDWNTPAKCTIKLNDTEYCSKDLEIKVYKRPTNVTVQSNGPAIKESQLELKCEVSDVAVVQNLTLTWYTNNSTVVKTKTFFSSKPNTTMTVTSSLMWTVKDDATFTCEASELGPQGPLFVSSDTWKLSVEYAPEFEEHEHNIHLNNSGKVSLHCEALGNPPPHYSWVKEGVNVANTANYQDQVNETTTFHCVASNDLGSANKAFIVTVMEKTPVLNGTTQASPKSSDCPLTIAPEELLVKFGDPTSANCSTTEADADGIGWEATTNGHGLEPVTHLEWKVEKVEVWTITASCYLSRNDGSHCIKPLSITIWKSPDEVQVSLNGNSSMVEGKPRQLICDVFNVAPVEKLQVKWYQNNALVHTDTDRITGSNGELRNVTSIWELTPKKEDNEANFTCEAELLLGQQGQNPKVVSEPYTANVQYKPSISSCLNYAGKESDFQLDTVPCKADGNPEPTIYWYFKDKRVNATEPLTRRDSGTYTAEFKNIIGSTNASVDISIEYGPSFSCKDHYNVTEDVNFTPECESDGRPKPKSVWSKNGMEIAFPKMWKRQDSGQYSVVARNQHGQANHTLIINVLYVPRFSEGDITIEFNLGENLTLECSADGNPPPLLRWEKHPLAANVNVSTRGRHSYIHVTQATSSNAGLYSCIATNEVGTVSKNVTLMIAVKPRALHNIIFISVALFVLLIICIGVLIYRNYRKKLGRYDVISDSMALTKRS